MRRFSCLLTLVVLCFTRPAAAAEDLREQASAALKKYYAERLRRPFIVTDDTPREKESPPPWETPLKNLSSAKEEDRRQATAFLRELLTLALQDERSGKAPWRNTPFWGGGAEVPARDLRKEVAEALAKAGDLPDAVPVLRWYLESETVDAFLEPVMAALGKQDSKEADKLRDDLLVGPHENALVVAEALNQIMARKRSVPAERLAALCQHHRALIRTAARKLNSQQGEKEPAPFDAAKALRTAGLRKLMGQVLALMPELPPAKAEFVEVTVKYRDEKKDVKETDEVQGWLIRREGDTVEVYTPYGSAQTFRNGEKKRIKHSERSPDGRGVRISEIDVTVEVAVAAGKIDALVKQVEDSRAKDNANMDLSERGPLTGQFRRSGATLYEAILGAWLYRAERDAEAARILLPALDSLYADHGLVDIVRQQMGEKYGYRMLVAFAGDRDFERAVADAKLISRLYPETRFHAYAQGLAEQLPRRADDFKKFKLLTPLEWTEQKKKLTRAQQIDFLCERLRLLNCFQMGQPGGYDPSETQYAEPCGMAANASWGLRKGKTEVINPLTELEGPTNWWNDQKPRPKGLELTLKDVPQISKHLRDDWYMLIVSFWRDFHPDRNLSSTRPQIAGIINGLARKNICKIESWGLLSPEEIDKEIERIDRWAAANAEKTTAQLEWDALEEAVAAGADWHRVEGRVTRLIEEKYAPAYEVLKRYLENEKTEPYSRAMIFQVYLKHDVTRAKDLAPKYLDAKERSLRFNAALVVFRTGDKSKAREVLGEGLATGEIDFWHGEAVESLLKDDTKESRQQVVRLFSNRGLAHERYGARAGILQKCGVAGLKEPYRFYLPLLDINKPELPHLNEKGEKSGTSFFDPTVAEEFAREITERFAVNDPDVREIVKKHPKIADQIPALKKWLQKRLEANKD